MLQEEILFKPVHQLAVLLHARQISPVELATSYLARIESLDAQLHAFVTVTRERALARAREAEKKLLRGRPRGPLHGIPYGVKDLLATAGTVTSWGAKPYETQRFDYDARVVRLLDEAGAVLLGKLAMIELAGGLGYSRGNASLTGAARNPWDRGRWTCGSSSGSGAAVAAALLPFALGSETWGLIICPSSFCGDSGLRPTFGLVSRGGAMALSWTLDKIGPMARSAEDCETVLHTIAGPDPGDPSCAGERAPAALPIERAKALRVACVELDFESSGDPDVERVFHEGLAALRTAGVAIESISLPELPFESTTVVLLTAEASSAFEELERSGGARRLVTAEAPLSFIVSRAVRGSDYVKADRVRRVCQKAMADLFERYDVILYPGEMHIAFPVEVDFSEVTWIDPVGAAGNLCGLPAISVPCGFSRGLPVSLTAMSGAFEDHKALLLARFYQSITDWHVRRPPLRAAGE